ncbi:MAG TPA: endonuclease/exonuclease/phosphatase family protein [Propionicimonas sp.]|uniref:endonuclease/exonuclease/phosphatase family protein n=1 Tax=Propionicimonas sp. TaxID=1955623 RepID=UPI002F40D536
MSGLVRRLLTLPLLAALLGIGLVAAPAVVPAYAASAPGGLHAVAVSSNAVALTWNKVSGADAYRVQFSTKSSMKSSKTVDVDTNYLEWTYLNPEPSANSGRLKPKTTYYFRVKVITKVDLNHSAKSLSKYGGKLKVKTSGTGSRTYLAPMKLKATDRSATSEYVSWNSRGPGIHYRVRYGTSPTLSGGNTATKVFDYSGGVLTGLRTGAVHYFSVETISRDNASTLSPASEIKSFTPNATAHPAIKIASYNICGNACGNWGGREPGMLDSLQRQAPDLIATQESTNSDDLISDYNALANRRFERIANHKHAGLAYDASRFSLVDSGINPWNADASKDAVWAILADKADNDRLLFAVSVHFTNGGGGDSQRKSEAAELVRMIEADSQGLPAVVAGDFNVSKRKSDHPAVYSTVAQAGLVDPLGNPSDSRYVSDSATVEHRIDVGYASANQFQRHALRSKWENGYDVDYIWHSQGVRVGSFQVVVDLDTRGDFEGTIPSDHNMLVSSFHLG